MSYVNSALVTGEQVLYEGHFHRTDKLHALLWCFVGVGLIWVIWMWSTEMVVTNRRVIYKRGWIARKTEEMSLRRVEEVNLRQGILGRILIYGKVQIQGTGGSAIHLPRIGAPMRFKRELQEAQARVEMLGG